MSLKFSSYEEHDNLAAEANKNIEILHGISFQITNNKALISLRGNNQFFSHRALFNDPLTLQRKVVLPLGHYAACFSTCP